MSRYAVEFRPVSRADFPLIGRWLAVPQVARWWNHDPSAEGVEADFGPTADGDEPGEDLLATVGGLPVGLVQRSRVAAYPENLEDFASVVVVPRGAVTIDYLVGDPDRYRRGLGSAMIAAVVERTWRDLPDAPAVLVSVVATNTASWRALERAGFTRVGQGDLAPDNPVDDPLHYIYRIDRPGRRAPS